MENPNEILTIQDVPMSGTGTTVPMQINLQSFQTAQAAMNSAKSAKPDTLNVAGNYYEWEKGKPVFITFIGIDQMQSKDNPQKMVDKVTFISPQLDDKGNILTDKDGNVKSNLYIAAQDILVSTLRNLGAKTGDCFFITKTGEKAARVSGKIFLFDIRFAIFE